MTEAEITAREMMLQSAVAMGDLQASHVAIYLTLVFAYMSFAYLAGRELSRIQLASVTTVFIAATVSEIPNIVHLGAGAVLQRNQLAAYSDVEIIEPIMSQTNWDAILIYSLGIVAACLFMWDRRRS